MAWKDTTIRTTHPLAGQQVRLQVGSKRDTLRTSESGRIDLPKTLFLVAGGNPRGMPSADGTIPLRVAMDDSRYQATDPIAVSLTEHLYMSLIYQGLDSLTDHQNKVLENCWEQHRGSYQKTFGCAFRN